MANKSETNGNNAGSSKAGKNIIIAGIAVIILLLVAVVVLLLTRGTGEMGKKEVTQEEDKRNVLVTEDNVKEVRRLHKIITDIYLKKSKLTKEILDKNFREKDDWFFTAKDALKYGLISKII